MLRAAQVKCVKLSVLKMLMLLIIQQWKTSILNRFSTFIKANMDRVCQICQIIAIQPVNILFFLKGKLSLFPVIDLLI